MHPLRPPPRVPDDPWSTLRAHTPARIALGRTGSGLPTREVLAFSAAHALAREAVNSELDVGTLTLTLQQSGLSALALASRSPDRRTYLLRPDLGRRLDEASQALLARTTCGVDIAVVICDGLSAHAVQVQARLLLSEFQPYVRAHAWSMSGPFVVKNGRVAVGDEIGEIVRARIVAVLIGERPGLRAPDSLGVYLTHSPRVGRVDAERACLSNIRPDGTSAFEAARKLADLIAQAFECGATGVAAWPSNRGLRAPE